jgi:PPOX class probable F420-dependent enzyme
MLNEKVHALATGPNLGTVSTVLPSGLIQSHPIWVDSDGEHILLNTEIHRRKYKNLLENPIATVTVLDRDNHWNWVEVRGQEARDHIDALAKKYMGVDDYPNPIQSERIILKIAPEQTFSFPPGQ